MIVIADQLEFTVLGLDHLFRDTLHVAFFLETIANQVGDGANADPVFARENFEVGPARHGSIFIEDLDNRCRRFETGKPCEVAAGFGMSSSCEHAAGL